ncbi:hypothetical protein [Burkholderia sp. 22313]|uniref:hypothetical protein n=1 Tax=Burkholderia sp. 22313 TaxID=3453908 RepID=UPI003F87F7D8
MKLTIPSYTEPAGDDSPPPHRQRSASPPSPKRRRLASGSLQMLESAGAPKLETVHGEANRPRVQLPGVSARRSEPPAQLSPSLEAKFGLEIEIPSVDVSAGGDVLRRGVILLDRPHWKLECDDNGGGKHDLEFVTNPLASEDDVRAAVREITALTAAIRSRALAGDMTVRLKDIVSDAKVDAVLQLNDPHMPGRLQATYGVGLDHVGMLIDELLPRKQAEGIHENTRAVADFYAARTGEPLPPKACSFIRLISMYLARAQAKLPADGTVHIFFRMMARSDFCAAFSKLLSPHEQGALRTLLVPSKDASTRVPMMMEALHMSDPDQLVFAKPYNLADRNPNHRQAGPTIKAWLTSIVEGRQEGPWQKDLLSPPVGYPLHSGDLSTDYGMGAMGVDERNGLILFEIRGAPYRPQHVTMNGQLARAADNELGRAGRHNPALKTAKRGPVSSAKYDALRGAEEAYAGLRNAAQTIEARAETLDAAGWRYLGRYFETQLAKLTKARTAISARSQSSWAPRLSQTMDELQKAAHDVLQTGNDGKLQDLVAKLEPFKLALARYEDVLWKSGASRK